jgi:hypothetical protein
LTGNDYNNFGNPTDPKLVPRLLDMLALGDPAQITDVINKWKGVEGNLETYNGRTTATGGASFTGTVRGLVQGTPPWQGQAADRYSQRTGDVSQYAMDLMNAISYSGGSGQNGVVTALTTVANALQNSHVIGNGLAELVTPETGSPPAGGTVYGVEVSCQQIVDLANQMVQQYQNSVATAMGNHANIPNMPAPSVIRLADGAVVQISLERAQGDGLVDPTSVTGTVTVIQPSNIKPKFPPVASLPVTGLTAATLFPIVNEAVRYEAALALNQLAGDYAKAAAQLPQPITGNLPQGVGGTGTNGGGYGAPPVPATGGVSPPVTDGVNGSKSNNGVTPLDNGSTNGATPTSSPLTDSGLTNSADSGLTDSGLTNSAPTDSGLANSGLTNPGLTGSGLTDNSPPTSVAGFTPPGTSGVGLTTPTPSSGLGSTNLPLTNVPTTGFTPSGGGIGGGFGSSGVPLAAGLMPGLYGGTGASSGYPAEEGLGTAARQAASESALNGESAAANAARSPGMYPPMFPPQMGQGGNERNRSTFLPEEDVWTEDLDVAPPLIVGASR